ncbi:hypothetical protein DK058_25890, partial [Salmonella enterica subsp. enterica serovar Typhi]|nr:hypothetical protein [Salmonella enterica subsp. enterica serovar Typhi]
LKRRLQDLCADPEGTRRGFVQHQYRARGPAGGKGPLHKNNTAWRIGSFEDSVDKHNRIDQLYYYDLVNDPDFLPYLMQLMDERVLHFLMCSHLGVGLTERPPRG